MDVTKHRRRRERCSARRPTALFAWLGCAAFYHAVPSARLAAALRRRSLSDALRPLRLVLALLGAELTTKLRHAGAPPFGGRGALALRALRLAVGRDRFSRRAPRPARRALGGAAISVRCARAFGRSRPRRRRPARARAAVAAAPHGAGARAPPRRRAGGCARGCCSALELALRRRDRHAPPFASGTSRSRRCPASASLRALSAFLQPKEFAEILTQKQLRTTAHRREAARRIDDVAP